MGLPSTLRVFFGHQSVGADIVEGLRRATGGRLRLAALGALTPQSLAAPGLGHARLGENGAPHTKLAAFERALAALDGQVDVALLKLCYVDLTRADQVDGLLAAYQQTLTRLGAAYPRVVFVPVTVPLTAVQSGLKGWVKRRLGRGAWGAQENAARHAYNQRLRAAHRGRPLFDLASVEATRDDGALETDATTGAPVPRLRADFTDDGGHLNQRGGDAAAQALLALLATLTP